MNEAYNAAIEQIKVRCNAYLAQFGERPSVLGVDAGTFETLRTEQQTSRDALQLVIPYTEESPVFDVPALWFVAVMKEANA